MPYEMKVSGMEEISKMLTDLEKEAESAAAQGLYEGAGIMADGIKQAARNLKTEKFHYTVDGQREPSPEEKEIVEQGIGVARFDKNGTEVNTSVGYGNSGYAMLNGKKVPIAKIANSINSGTSFMRKQPYVRQAEKKVNKQASEAIAKKIQDRFDDITKENGN